MAINLGQLIDVIDLNRDSTVEKIQICRADAEWEDYDEAATSSALLIPLYPAPVKCMEAVDQYVVRVDIDWDALPFFEGRKE